jgi:serine protease Do
VVEQATGPAARAGIKKGDVILALNNQKIEDGEQLKRLVDGAGKRAALLVDRDGTRLYVPVTLG